MKLVDDLRHRFTLTPSNVVGKNGAGNLSNAITPFFGTTISCFVDPLSSRFPVEIYTCLNIFIVCNGWKGALFFKCNLSKVSKKGT